MYFKLAYPHGVYEALCSSEGEWAERGMFYKQPPKVWNGKPW